MANFGTQTSPYNRLVTIFVAIGSLVSDTTLVAPDFAVLFWQCIKAEVLTTIL